MKVTETEVKSLIIGCCQMAGISGNIKLSQAAVIANWLYNKFGLSVTTLFVEKVWNDHVKEETRNED